MCIRDRHIKEVTFQRQVSLADRLLYGPAVIAGVYGFWLVTDNSARPGTRAGQRRAGSFGIDSCAGTNSHCSALDSQPDARSAVYGGAGYACNARWPWRQYLRAY